MEQIERKYKIEKNEHKYFFVISYNKMKTQNDNYTPITCELLRTDKQVGQDLQELL